MRRLGTMHDNFLNLCALMSIKGGKAENAG